MAEGVISSNVFCETLSIELKEFFLKGTSKISNDKCEELILSGSLYEKDLVLNSLVFYINKYIPKYISGWNNEDLDLDEGVLYFGVKDDGSVVGIPYDGELDKKIIREMILSISEMISCENKEELLESIGIDIISIDPTKVDMMAEYEKEVSRFEQFQRYRKGRVKEYIEWHKNTLHWHCKVIDVLNDIKKRELFVSWLRKHCNVDTKDDIIKEVLDWEVKEDFGFMVTDVKEDKRGMIHWLCLFKDLTLAGRGPRPIIPPFKPPRWDKFYLSPYKMNYYLSQVNPDAKFYLIKFTIPNTKKDVLALSKGEWTQYIRVENELGPSSVPVEDAGNY